MLPSRIYLHIRAQQLDGNYPSSPEDGTWLTSSMRVLGGWGSVSEDDWPYPKDGDSWPPAEPPNLDSKAKAGRMLRYQRIRDLDDIRYALVNNGPFTAAFDITEDWFSAPLGVIPATEEYSDFIGAHAISIQGYDDTSDTLKFVNSWGANWGNAGYGTIPYSYLDNMQEAWTITSELASDLKDANGGSLWDLPDVTGRTVMHGVEIRKSDDDRCAWAFAIERDGELQVEELFVRPEYRSAGNGTILIEELQHIALERQLPLRAYVTHADLQPNNDAILDRLFSRVGLSRSPTRFRWSLFHYSSHAGPIHKSEQPEPPTRPGLFNGRFTT